MKTIVFTLLIFISTFCHAQYVAVRAKYIDTRLVDDSPNPPKRQNHLILDFYYVSPGGVYTPANLVNYDIYIGKEGLQFGSLIGGVLDSTGNNYPGYSYPAPRAVSYYNTLGVQYTDCDTYTATHYVVNGSQLDVGWIGVSYYDVDGGTGNQIECFTAPNIHLPYYQWPDPYYYSPGNLNFSYYDLGAGPPYNMYNFWCPPNGTLQLVMRGLLAYDSITIGNPLPVNFAYVRGEIDGTNTARISWSNLTESDISAYTIEKSEIANSFQTIGTVLPKKNTGDSANYQFETIQSEEKSLYRVKATEISGKVFYSNIIVLKKDASSTIPDEPGSSLLVYPNPVTGSEFTFQLLNAEKGRYIASVVSPEGRELRQKLIEHNGGNLTRQVDLFGLPAGLYRLVLRGERKKYTQSILYVN